MDVGLLEAQIRATASTCAGCQVVGPKNGYRFEFGSTTPILAIFGEYTAKFGLERARAPRHRLGRMQ